MGNARAVVPAAPRGSGRRDDLLSSRARSATSSVIRDLLELVDEPGMLSLAGGLPAPELLPVERVATATDRVLRTCGPRALQYAPTEGMAEVRVRIAARADHDVDADEVLVTTGSQQGLDLLARALCDPGDVVVVESPGYLGALQAFQAAGARLVAVPTDADGIRTDDLEATLIRLAADDLGDRDQARVGDRYRDRGRAGGGPKVVYVVANFQNPSGATLSRARRRHLLELADRFGFVVVEDDPYGALRFRGRAEPSLRALAQGPARDGVVSLGTVSKIISPGLRVGWMIGPAWLRGALVKAKQAADLHTSSLTQLVAAEILGDEEFLAGHLDRIRSTYRDRADALTTALAEALSSEIEVGRVDGGMFCWARLTGGVSAAELFPAAVDAQVSFVPGDAFSVDDSGRSHLRLCFTTLTPDQLAEASSRLAAALGSLAETGRP